MKQKHPACTSAPSCVYLRLRGHGMTRFCASYAPSLKARILLSATGILAETRLMPNQAGTTCCRPALRSYGRRRHRRRPSAEPRCA